MWPWFPYGLLSTRDFMWFPQAEKDPWKRRTKSRSWSRFQKPKAKITKHRKQIKKMANLYK